MGPGMRDLLVAAGGAALSIGIVLVLGVGGYPGGPDDCILEDDCYCETVGGGLIAQPVNAWSNLAFVVAGLAVLADAGRRRERGSRPPGPRMVTDPVYPRLYGAAGVFIGVGSFAFHASMRAWGGNVDLISMYAYVGLFICYDLARIHDWDRRVFLWWSMGATVLLSSALLVIPPQSGKWLFAAFVGVALLVELAVSLPGLRPWAPLPIDSPRTPWFWAGLGSFAAAAVIWDLSRSGGVWCRPESAVQGHAFWHLLGGTAVWCFYRYFAAERVGSDPVGR